MKYLLQRIRKFDRMDVILMTVLLLNGWNLCAAQSSDGRQFFLSTISDIMNGNRAIEASVDHLVPSPNAATTDSHGTHQGSPSGSWDSRMFNQDGHMDLHGPNPGVPIGTPMNVHAPNPGVPVGTPLGSVHIDLPGEHNNPIDGMPVVHREGPIGGSHMSEKVHNPGVPLGTPIDVHSHNPGVPLGTPIDPHGHNPGVPLGTPIDPHGHNPGVPLGTPIDPHGHNTGVPLGTPIDVGTPLGSFHIDMPGEHNNPIDGEPVVHHEGPVGGLHIDDGHGLNPGVPIGTPVDIHGHNPGVPLGTPIDPHGQNPGTPLGSVHIDMPGEHNNPIDSKPVVHHEGPIGDPHADEHGLTPGVPIGPPLEAHGHNSGVPQPKTGAKSKTEEHLPPFEINGSLKHKKPKKPKVKKEKRKDGKVKQLEKPKRNKKAPKKKKEKTIETKGKIKETAVDLVTELTTSSPQTDPWETTGTDQGNGRRQGKGRGWRRGQGRWGRYNRRGRPWRRRHLGGRGTWRDTFETIQPESTTTTSAPPPFPQAHNLEHGMFPQSSRGGQSINTGRGLLGSLFQGTGLNIGNVRRDAASTAAQSVRGLFGPGGLFGPNSGPLGLTFGRGNGRAW